MPPCAPSSGPETVGAPWDPQTSPHPALLTPPLFAHTWSVPVGLALERTLPSPLSSQGCPLCSWLPWPPQSSVTRLDPARGDTGVLSLITLSDQLTFRAALRKLGSKCPSSQALRGQVEGESTLAPVLPPLCPPLSCCSWALEGPLPKTGLERPQGMGWGRTTLGLWNPLEVMGPGGEPTSPAGWRARKGWAVPSRVDCMPLSLGQGKHTPTPPSS